MVLIVAWASRCRDTHSSSIRIRRCAHGRRSREREVVDVSMTLPLPLALSLSMALCIATRIGLKVCRIKTLIMLSNACVLALRNMTPWIRVPVTCCRHGIMLNRLLGSSSFTLVLLLEMLLKLVWLERRRDVLCHSCKVLRFHERGVSGACACASAHGASCL